ncbi:DsbA family protein [Acidimicrobiia bacterium EGI L10123]|uniref:DsbA family protein n=1 Tax=Salinilacustrithrix flava TaxID=2957203 RepID=UPI003D7C1554|nr:DsbA family protein [Acidimicrobiia bacterium EGI L10123]
MQVEVFADVWCPFTHVGLRRFVELRTHMDVPPVLVVRSWPLELVNGAPMDPAFIAEEVDDIRGSVAPDLFTGFDPARFPTTTLGALALTGRAYEQSPTTGEAVALELRDRLFERGDDIGDPHVLAAVAAAHGLATEAGDDLPRRDWEEGKARGVIGSPHFFTPGGNWFCPSLDVSRTDDGHLRITDDPEGFDAFVRSCQEG